MRLALLIAMTVAAALLAPASASPSSSSCHRPTSSQMASLPSQYPVFYRALRADFGAHWAEAATVSYGEGTWHSWASNGQYRGTFQMGARERAKYGDSSTLAGQSHAAARYWNDAGWEPWDCSP